VKYLSETENKVSQFLEKQNKRMTYHMSLNSFSGVESFVAEDASMTNMNLLPQVSKTARLTQETSTLKSLEVVPYKALEV
jgi:hypothetical protein